jgi:hypothetical protein
MRMIDQFVYYSVSFDKQLRCALCTPAEVVDQNGVTISFLDPVKGRC